MNLQEAGTAPDLEIHMDGDYAAVWGDVIFTDIDGDYDAFIDDSDSPVCNEAELRLILLGARLKI